MVIFSFLAVLCASIFVITFSVLITTPFLGTLVRYRANYNPRGLRLDADGNPEVHTGPIVNSYLGMFMRVKRLEGWSGLYKGSMPNLIISVIILVLFAVLSGGITNPATRHGKYSTPDLKYWQLFIYASVMSLLALPGVVITNRSITTPHKLPWFNPVLAYRVLLSPYERRRPWVLFFTPGLLVSEAASLVYALAVLGTMRQLLFPALFQQEGNIYEQLTALRLSLYFVVVIVSVAILTPLEVISTRLSIQRNHEAENVEEDFPPGMLEYAAAEEDVIALRNEDDPYLGFGDCMKRVIHEEGYGTLYRAWWLTLTATLL